MIHDEPCPPDLEQIADIGCRRLICRGRLTTAQELPIVRIRIDEQHNAPRRSALVVVEAGHHDGKAGQIDSSRPARSNIS
jgi:hypothetical protein